MAFDVHCWSCLCVYPGLNDSLGENNEMFSWYNWIVWVRQKKREGKREHVMEHVWDYVVFFRSGVSNNAAQGPEPVHQLEGFVKHEVITRFLF